MLNYIISLLPKAKDKDTDKTKPHPWLFPNRFVFAYYYDVGPTCINKQLIPTHHKYHFFIIIMILINLLPNLRQN